jgi:hypothetical protein
MKETIVPFAHHGISGGIAVKLRNNATLDDFSKKYIPNYDADRFEAIAIRLFSGKEVIITLYALDKFRQEGNTYNPDKIPVKKFKIMNIPVTELFLFFEEFNLTLSTGNYSITDMEVINK